MFFSEESSLRSPETHVEVIGKNELCTQNHAQKSQPFPGLTHEICFEIAEVMLIFLEKSENET